MVNCHDPNCFKTFTKVLQNKRHNTRNHCTKNFYHSQNIVLSRHSDTAAANNEDSFFSTALTNSEPPENVDLNESSLNLHHDFKKQFASYMLNIKERHLLPDTIQQSLTSEVEMLVKHTENSYRILLERGLHEIGANAKKLKLW